MKRILAIDDEDFILECLEAALTQEGYEVVTTQDPAEFLALLREQRFDLVLLDVKMPVKSGFELCRELRAMESHPVLFITAYPKAFDPEEKDFSELWKTEFADGNTDVLYKPFALGSLFEKVEGLIGLAADPESR